MLLSFTCRRWSTSVLPSARFLRFELQPLSKFHSLTKSPCSSHGMYLQPRCSKPVNISTRGVRKGPFNQQKPEGEIVDQSLGVRNLRRSAVFTALVCGCSFAGASILQYESVRSRIIRMREATSEQFYAKTGTFRQHLNLYWNSLNPSQQLIAGIISANIAVFVLWRFAPVAFMTRYFLANPYSASPLWGQILHAYSHVSLLHLGANMFVLWSFAPLVSVLLEREQLLAFYLSAGAIAGFGSYMLKVALRRPIPSLGASGAVLGVFGLVCSKMPDSRVSVILLDQLFPHSFSAKHAMFAILAMDTLGIIFRWRFFDHGGHLAGMLFGIFYSRYGPDIWNMRKRFIESYHKLRSKT